MKGVVNSMKIQTIDLWIPDNNHRNLIYNKAFRAGLDAKRAYSNKAISKSYDKVVFYQNCNIAMEFSLLNLDYRHTAILFFKDEQPIRLLVDNAPAAEVQAMYEYATQQRLGPNGQYSLKRIIEENNISIETVDLKEKPILRSQIESGNEQIVSCDRWDLFLQIIDNMKESRAEYAFDPYNIFTVAATLDTWEFDIVHRGMFYNHENTHYITLQTGSPLALG